MASLDSAFFNLGRLDRLAAQETPVHRLDPRAKLLTTLVFLVCVVSFPKYEISGLLPFFLYPVVLLSSGRLPSGFLAARLAAVAPLAILVGIFNPILDREIRLASVMWASPAGGFPSSPSRSASFSRWGRPCS